MNPFDAHPEFLAHDNRIHRQFNPITKEALTNKHQAILPPHLVKNKSVLDLGSCIGATGNWCLFHGASSYTGVEVQPEYFEKSRNLLSVYKDKATVINASLEEFLAANSVCYDIVLLLAVLHVFIDFHRILKDSTRFCRQLTIIENLRCRNPGPVVHYTPDSRINLAGSSLSSLSGVGVRISRSALDIILASLGFEEMPAVVVPPITDSVDVYNTHDLKESRYIAAYRRAKVELHSLSEDLATSRSGARIPWSQDRSAWSFDKKVADNFDVLARTNIPNYDQVITKCIRVAARQLRPTDKIIDIGSALGFTLKSLHEAGFRNLWGVDSSPHMLSKSWQQDGVTLIKSDRFPSEHVPFSLVIANWVLHFIEEREAYIEDIYEGLAEDGIMILSEKVSSHALSQQIYYDYKRDCGICEQEIQDKRQALAGILKTKPLLWYFETCRKAGFSNVEVIDASFSFVTLMAFK